jgi:hypothetical protein
MKPVCKIASIIAAVGFVAVTTQAQFYPPMTFDPSLAKFFEEGIAFSANMEVITTLPNTKWPVRVALLKGMTRIDMDITQMEDRTSPAEAEAWKHYVGNMKKAGSAESVSIFNPSRKSLFIVLPRLNAYLQKPIEEKQLDELKKRPKYEKTELGKETIDGHPCVKYKVSFNKDVMDVWRTWESSAAILWCASDLKGCPIRIEVFDSTGNTNSTLVLKDVVLKAPESRLFEPPKGFKKCADEKALMEEIMKKWPEDK